LNLDQIFPITVSTNAAKFSGHRVLYNSLLEIKSRLLYSHPRQELMKSMREQCQANSLPSILPLSAIAERVKLTSLFVTILILVMYVFVWTEQTYDLP
jgi:hypothetical protein